MTGILAEDERDELCNNPNCIRHGRGTVGCPVLGVERRIEALLADHGVNVQEVLDL